MNDKPLNKVAERESRTLIDAWRDEWHLEPEPERDNIVYGPHDQLPQCGEILRDSRDR